MREKCKQQTNISPYHGWPCFICPHTLLFRTIRVHQCWVSLWHVSCWGRPPPSCSPSSHRWTALWMRFMTRAVLGGGYWRSQRNFLSRGCPSAPADASRRTCVSPRPTRTLACSPQVGSRNNGIQRVVVYEQNTDYLKGHIAATKLMRIFTTTTKSIPSLFRLPVLCWCFVSGVRGQRGARQPLGLPDQPTGATHWQTGVRGPYKICSCAKLW